MQEKSKGEKVGRKEERKERLGDKENGVEGS